MPRDAITNIREIGASELTKRPKQYDDVVFAAATASRAFENLKRFRRTWGWAFPDPGETPAVPAGSRARAVQHRPGIDRAAIYPPSHILHFSILAGLVLFEGLANAYFFSKGSDLGLLGGWLQAITVSFTNVIAAFFIIGFLCLRHLSNPKKLWFFIPAAIALPFAVAAIFVLNLTAAHYRDLLEVEAATLALGGAAQTGAMLTPVTAMLENPFGLQSLEALLLLILGLTFAAIAAFKGRTFDDAIPGYGVVQRKSEAAARELKRAVEAAIRRGGSYSEREAAAIQNAEILLDEILTDLASDGQRRGEPVPPPHASAA
ncbi:MAG: hypothetical protein KIS81_10885 [Maricaulaceae bacterium]|nr:hypothetical protein [Maricaulaceae bacterium]